MKSKDLILQELKDNLVTAFKSTDENAIAQAFTPFAEAIQQNVMEEFKAYQPIVQFLQNVEFIN